VADPTPKSDEVSGSYQYLIVNRITRMNDAKANREKDKYYVFFKFACQLVMPYMSIKTKQKMQRDFMELGKIEKAIKEDKNLSDLSKQTQLDEIHSIFADNRELYIMEVMPKTGIIKVMEEGGIDFEKRDIEAIKAAVLATGTGLIGAVEKHGNGLPTSQPPIHPKQ